MTERRGRGRPRMQIKSLNAAQTELVAIRQQLGWTQDALAQALGVTLNTVSRWERGERDVPQPALRLARQLLRQQ